MTTPSAVPVWFKSSYSADEGSQCLEVALPARHSGSETIHVRDSKVPHGPVLDLSPAAWAGLAQWVSG
ncbi:DUF397 domain-containing protein [Streptomyces sp. NPDC060031]|uniref:DUF397 domain-containing protein n=1 Tax=Streptomyces sp. NPDC060031 TaxID=3347043 RepID=UPI00368FB483